MACKNVCKLCPNLIISQAVTFTAGTGLIINLPAGNYNDNQKYCIVVAQSIPAATTITAPVFVMRSGSLEQTMQASQQRLKLSRLSKKKASISVTSAEKDF